jgi:DNA polymerase-4/DNA polymerase V
MTFYFPKSFSKAILHIDGDCFFASCEIAKNPSLNGNPIITGKERGIASSMSYEAKSLGIKRAMRISEILKICPDAIILPSDYETYSLYSKRMFNIVRRYTPEVEEYSIDECFADLTGLQRPLKMSYKEMAEKIKHDLDSELGISFSVGLSVNKILAKIASKWNKPSGLTVISQDSINSFLNNLPIDKVWGIGPQTSSYMKKLSINTALDFTKKDIDWVSQKFFKPHIEIWRELRGDYIYPINSQEKHDYQSISKTCTFTPASSNKNFVFSQLSKNIENACIKLRRHNLYSDTISIFLKTQDFRFSETKIRLDKKINYAQDFILLTKNSFETIFKENTLYRATGVSLSNLSSQVPSTLNLFEKQTRDLAIEKVSFAIDTIAKKYGKHSIFLGSSMVCMTQPKHKGERGSLSQRENHLLKGESSRKRLGIPYLGKVK